LSKYSTINAAIDVLYEKRHANKLRQFMVMESENFLLRFDCNGEGD